MVKHQLNPPRLAMQKLTYFKRHRMELALRHPRPAAELPPGFSWVPWSAGTLELLELHAQVKFMCFVGEPDAQVFPCLGSLAGCRELMAAILSKPGFCPGATWLVTGPQGCVGTVQGLLDSSGYGGVQNLGVMEGYRGLGIGRALLLKALHGFEEAGSRRAYLEVTAANTLAVKMYRQFGFRAFKTIYRGVDLEPAVADTVGAGI